MISSPQIGGNGVASSSLTPQSSTSLKAATLVQEIEQNHAVDLSGNSRARRRLQDYAEKAKCALSTSETAPIEIDNLLGCEDFYTVITRVRFENLCSDLFLQSMELVTACLDDARLEPQDIDEVVLVGGSTRIPKVKSLLKQIFAAKRLNHRTNPDEAVAYGAAIQAAMLADRRPSNLQELKLKDVAPLSLGIGLQDNTVAVLIPKNTQIPVSRTCNKFVIAAGCGAATIAVYQGEARLARDSNLLGEFVLLGLPRSNDRSRQIVVTFQIDGNGILAVKAMHVGSGKWRQVRVDRRNGGLMCENVQQMKYEAEQFDKAAKR